MTRYFTHYWNTGTCEFQESGGELEHTAGNDFIRKSVSPGDIIYVVNVLHGRLRVLGRMQVCEIVSYERARRVLGDNIWEAEEHCLATPGTATLMRLDRFVSLDVVRRLRFLRGDGAATSPTFKAHDPDLLDQQTLRSVRRLTPQSAALLDELLDDETV